MYSLTGPMMLVHMLVSAQRRKESGLFKLWNMQWSSGWKWHWTRASIWLSPAKGLEGFSPTSHNNVFSKCSTYKNKRPGLSHKAGDPSRYFSVWKNWHWNTKWMLMFQMLLKCLRTTPWRRAARNMMEHVSTAALTKYNRLDQWKDQALEDL